MALRRADLDAPPAQAAFGSLAVIDLDGLKAINDTHGHHVGDQAIRAFARALRARLRADDLIFRWGGDEFLAVMFGLFTRFGGAASAAAAIGLGVVAWAWGKYVWGVEAPYLFALALATAAYVVVAWIEQK